MGVGGGSETGGQSGSGLTGTSFNSYRAGPLDVDSHTLLGPLAPAAPLASCVAQSAPDRRSGSTFSVIQVGLFGSLFLFILICTSRNLFFFLTFLSFFFFFFFFLF